MGPWGWRPPVCSCRKRNQISYIVIVKRFFCVLYSVYLRSFVHLQANGYNKPSHLVNLSHYTIYLSSQQQWQFLIYNYWAQYTLTHLSEWAHEFRQHGDFWLLVYSLEQVGADVLPHLRHVRLPPDPRTLQQVWQAFCCWRPHLWKQKNDSVGKWFTMCVHISTTYDSWLILAHSRRYGKLSAADVWTSWNVFIIKMIQKWFTSDIRLHVDNCFNRQGRLDFTDIYFWKCNTDHIQC